MDKLKPCPFCGGVAKLQSDTWPRFVFCTSCFARTVNCPGFGDNGSEQAIERWNRRECESKWISVKDGLPPERDTIFAKLYGTDKWRDAMFRRMSDDVRVVKMLRDGVRRVHHDHTVDGVWDCERKGDIYGRVTHWMPNPELPEVAT